MRRLMLIVCVPLLFAQASILPAQEVVSAVTVGTCVSNGIAANLAVSECVNEAQNQCFAFEATAPMAATLCFINAKEQWITHIAARMDLLETQAEPQIAAIAGIEVKYDMLQNELQCARIQELMLLQQEPDGALQLQKSRCEATAVGLTYVKLLLQSRSFD